MPRYSFTVVFADAAPAPPVVATLADPDAAWEAARAMAADLLARNAHPRLLAATMVVADAGGGIVLEFPFSEAVAIPPAALPRLH